MLHQENSPNWLTHVSSQIHLSLDIPSEEPLKLRNMIVVEVEKSSETCDRDSYHPERIF